MTYTDNSAGLEIFAKIHASLGALTDHLKKEREDRMRRLAKAVVTPVLGKMEWSGVCNGSGFGIFVNTGAMAEGPDQGYLWYVRRISILGTVVGGSISGRGDVFISAADFPNSFTSLAQFSVGAWQDGTNTIPNNAFYGRGEMPMRFNESLTIVISGAGANQVVGGQIVFEQFEEAAIRQDWAV